MLKNLKIKAVGKEKPKNMVTKAVGSLTLKDSCGSYSIVRQKSYAIEGGVLMVKPFGAREQVLPFERSQMLVLWTCLR